MHRSGHHAGETGRGHWHYPILCEPADKEEREYRKQDVHIDARSISVRYCADLC